MTAKIEARHIKDIPWGGVANQGHVVLFDLTFHDGTRERYALDAGLAQLLVGNITQYGEMAQNVRVKGAERALESSAPYKVVRVARSGYSPDGKIVSIEFATNHGFPVALAMTKEQAQTAVSFLEREILNAQDPVDNRN